MPVSLVQTVPAIVVVEDMLVVVKVVGVVWLSQRAPIKPSVHMHSKSLEESPDPLALSPLNPENDSVLQAPPFWHGLGVQTVFGTTQCFHPELIPPPFS